MTDPARPLYQRARPTHIADVVGQEHVREVLAAQVAHERLAHAYLLSGPRGVGKTTTARLIAAAANCRDPEQTGTTPCGQCTDCHQVQAGNHPNVAEIDAASNNSVDDIRDVRERVALAPLGEGRRVYILDEAHMLSKGAANALLKTLEEPPPGVIFVLATTEPERLPPTIASRCQHFRFRRLSDEEIAGKLARLCAENGLQADADALRTLARGAAGALRDAESALDRVLATSPERLDRALATRVLGLPPDEGIEAIAAGLQAGDMSAANAATDVLYRDGISPRSILAALTQKLLDLALAPDAPPALLRAVEAADRETVRLGRGGGEDLLALRVAMIRVLATFEPAAALAPHPAPPPQGGSPPPQPSPTRGEGATTPHPDPPPRAYARGEGDAAAPPREPARGEVVAGWPEVCARVPATLRAVLTDAEVEEAGGTVHLRFRTEFHHDRTKAALGDLERIAAQVYGQPVKVVTELAGGERSKKNPVSDPDGAAAPERPDPAPDPADDQGYRQELPARSGDAPPPAADEPPPLPPPWEPGSAEAPAAQTPPLENHPVLTAIREIFPGRLVEHGRRPSAGPPPRLTGDDETPPPDEGE
jgi:DNA polymerase-3 subunit gamma/tau